MGPDFGSRVEWGPLAEDHFDCLNENFDLTGLVISHIRQQERGLDISNIDINS